MVSACITVMYYYACIMQIVLCIFYNAHYSFFLDSYLVVNKIT